MQQCGRGGQFFALFFEVLDHDGVIHFSGQAEEGQVVGAHAAAVGDSDPAQPAAGGKPDASQVFFFQGLPEAGEKQLLSFLRINPAQDALEGGVGYDHLAGAIEQCLEAHFPGLPIQGPNTCSPPRKV